MANKKDKTIAICCGGRGIGRTYIDDILKYASMHEEDLEKLTLDSERQKTALDKIATKFQCISEVDYKPSITELKKQVKKERNPLRQQQLRREIAELEREQRINRRKKWKECHMKSSKS